MNEAAVVTQTDLQSSHSSFHPPTVARGIPTRSVAASELSASQWAQSVRDRHCERLTRRRRLVSRGCRCPSLDSRPRCRLMWRCLSMFGRRCLVGTDHRQRQGGWRSRGWLDSAGVWEWPTTKRRSLVHEPTSRGYGTSARRRCAGRKCELHWRWGLACPCCRQWRVRACCLETVSAEGRYLAGMRSGPRCLACKILFQTFRHQRFAGGLHLFDLIAQTVCCLPSAASNLMLLLVSSVISPVSCFPSEWWCDSPELVLYGPIRIEDPNQQRMWRFVCSAARSGPTTWPTSSSRWQAEQRCLNTNFPRPTSAAMPMQTELVDTFCRFTLLAAERPFRYAPVARRSCAPATAVGDARRYDLPRACFVSIALIRLLVQGARLIKTSKGLSSQRRRVRLPSG